MSTEHKKYLDMTPEQLLKLKGDDLNKALSAHRAKLDEIRQEKQRVVGSILWLRSEIDKETND